MVVIVAASIWTWRWYERRPKPHTVHAEVAKIPYVIVWGDKESEDAIAVRTHGGEQSTKSLSELLAELRQAATV